MCGNCMSNGMPESMWGNCMNKPMTEGMSGNCMNKPMAEGINSHRMNKPMAEISVWQLKGEKYMHSHVVHISKNSMET